MQDTGIIQKDDVKRAIDLLSDSEIQQVADFIAFLQFRQQKIAPSWQTLLDSLNQFSDDFMTTRVQPPYDLREPLE